MRHSETTLDKTMTQPDLSFADRFGSRAEPNAAVGLQDFQALKHRRTVERELLPFLKTAVDFDIVCEVGFHELTLVPLTVKHLILLQLAPQMTVFRRLNRLCNMSIIQRTRSLRDARVHELRLGTSTRPLLVRYAWCTQRGDDA